MSEKTPVHGKVMRETKYLQYIMIELLNGDMMVFLIIDKEKRAILGIGLTRKEAFETAYANADRKMSAKIEELELQ
ncbi:MAG: hypothetical protein RXN93_06665 [Thermocladium sp.]